MANEKRLIDANKLMKAIKSFRWLGVPNTLQLMFDYLKIIIRDQPTVDAVEVIRCKDCVSYNGEGCLKTYGEFEPDPMFFCSYGERKTNG